MAHFAEVDKNNIVIRVVVVDDNTIRNSENREDEALGRANLEAQLGGTWIQTSYNGKIRKHFAGKGMLWDEGRNAFYGQQPFKSWTLNEDTLKWEPPTPLPEDAALGRAYEWNEKKKQWEEDVRPPSWSWNPDAIYDDPISGESIPRPQYEPPVAYPDDPDNQYDWDEETTSWVVRPSE